MSSNKRGVSQAPAPQRMQASALMMCAALALLFFGYEGSRAASIALLAAKDVGLGSEALPFTVALGSPAGALVLYLYARSIKTNGSRYTLRVSNMVCAAILTFMTFSSSYFVKNGGNAGKALVITFYVFREIYVSLLSTQHWSFLASVLDRSSTSYLVKSAGIVSISSAVGSCAVELLVHHGGMWTLLATSCFATFLSWTFAEIAYAMSPAAPHQETRVPPRPERQQRVSVWKDSWELMFSHYTLKLLFFEAIMHQACSNMLNLLFHDGLRRSVAKDAARAVIVGRFFASVNISACLLQCFVMPRILSHRTLPLFIKVIPVIVLCATSLSFISESQTTVMLGFGVMKVLEYSVMTSAMEMIYMPMGHEVRYLGKELIRFFGHRLGKSGTSLLLSAASAHFRPTLQAQAVWSSTLIALWGGAMSLLSSHLNASNLDKSNHSLDSESPQRNRTEAVQPPVGRSRPLENRESKESFNGDDDVSENAGQSTSTAARSRENSEGDFDQTFYYAVPQNSASQNFMFSQDGNLVSSSALSGHITPTTSSSNLSSAGAPQHGNGLRYRPRRPSGESLSPNPGPTIFDATVFGDTGFYLAREVSLTDPPSEKSLDDDEDNEDYEDDTLNVGMVRVGSQHVSLNYLAALSEQDSKGRQGSAAMEMRR